MTPAPVTLQRLYAEVDPWAALAGALLARAQADAEAGDLAALGWLIVVGSDLAARLHPDGDDLVLSFARATLAQVDAGRVRARWNL